VVGLAVLLYYRASLGFFLGSLELALTEALDGPEAVRSGAFVARGQITFSAILASSREGH